MFLLDGSTLERLICRGIMVSRQVGFYGFFFSLGGWVCLEVCSTIFVITWEFGESMMSSWIIANIIITFEISSRMVYSFHDV